VVLRNGYAASGKGLRRAKTVQEDRRAEPRRSLLVVTDIQAVLIVVRVIDDVLGIPAFEIQIGQFFEIDTYKNELEGLVILEAKGVDEGEPIKFPPFIEVIEDITGNVNYFNHNLARKFN